MQLKIAEFGIYVIEIGMLYANEPRKSTPRISREITNYSEDT